MIIAEEMKGVSPSALFTCGAEDPLLEDSVTTTAKWLMGGGQATLRLYPGALYGFIGFHEKLLKVAGDGLREFGATSD